MAISALHAVGYIQLIRLNIEAIITLLSKKDCKGILLFCKKLSHLSEFKHKT